MKVLEIKNNLVKVSYDIEDKLVLAGFTVIEDEATPYVGQIVSLKADNGISYAIVKLLFTFDSEGIVRNYDGSIPQLGANAAKLSSAELLDILPVKTPLKLGNIAEQDFLLNVDISMLQNNLLICSDSAKNTATLISNFAKQLENNAESSIIFDIDGKFKDDKKLVFGKDFKLPLNFETINFIYANDLNDIEATSKAVIQDIFLEVQEYTRTIPDKYIPFDTFIDVVTQQYVESNIPELALLKNKLLKYKEEKVFAQSKYEIISLKEYIKDNYTVIIDISNVDAKLQREIICYVYSVLEETDAYITSFVKVNDQNSDKKLLKLLLNENKIFTNIICNHNYKYVYELKEKAEDLILFTPETTQHDFAAYNTFLNKLNHDEFIVWGKATQRIPLIVELAPVEIITDEPVQVVSTPILEQPLQPLEETDDEQIETDAVAIEDVTVLKEEHPDETEDFTENEDTYTDLSDDIERIPFEEEDYSALDEKEVEETYEEVQDDFDKELENCINDVVNEDTEFIAKEPESINEAPANDFFTQTETSDEPEVIISDEVIIQDDEVIEEEEIVTEEPTIRDETETVTFEPVFEEEEIEEETFEPQSEIVLPAPEIDERIEEDLPVIKVEETEQDDEEPTPFENSAVIEPAPLMSEDNALNDELIEQVAKDIDKNFIYSKIEEERIDDSENEDILTEDDLNFIDDINHGEPELLEPVIDEPDNFEEDDNSYYKEEDPSPVVPVYPAETPVSTQTFEQGDHVSHPKYGEGIVEKMIKYGNKTLCSINFVNVGRRLLDPAISEITKL